MQKQVQELRVAAKTVKVTYNRSGQIQWQDTPLGRLFDYVVQRLGGSNKGNRTLVMRAMLLLKPGEVHIVCVTYQITWQPL